MGRSQKALKNVSTGIINKLVLMLLAFSTRTLFIRMLGAEYNGVSSLYSNILSVLSLAELGLGNVLMFYLYSALQERDENKICQLVQEFKRIYRGIIIAVFAIGLLLVPFLQYIINSSLNQQELIVYYLLYLVNSVASYFVIYRTMVIAADQKSYIQNRCNTITTVAMYLLQIVYLLVSKDFLGYLVIQVLCTIGNNLILNYIACKQYPYLKKKIEIRSHYVDKKDLFNNIKATFLYKLADKALDQTQSIIISIIFGTVLVGYYSNYYMIILYLVNFGGIIANGLVAGLGNLSVENNNEKSYSVFRASMLMFSFFGIFCTTCYACIVQDFIPLWVGAEYLMDYDVVIAILAVFYLRMATNTVWMYRAAMGLFKEVQYINVIAAVLNIILAVVLGNYMGVAGVVVASAAARLLTSFWYEGKVVFNRMGKSLSAYFLIQLKDLLALGVTIALSMWLSNKVSLIGVSAIVVKIGICSVVTGTVMLAVNFKTEAFQVLLRKVLQAVKK